MTKAYMLFLARWARRLSWKETAEAFRAAWEKVFDAVEHVVTWVNYFRAQKLLSNGVVEGLNYRAKVTLRRSYGFRTFRVLELALYHSLGKLPEPECTHEFF